MSSCSSPIKEKNVIRNRDMLALKSYITAKDDNPRDGLGGTTLLIDLTHSNLVQRHIEIRFDKRDDNITDVKNKIHQKTGTAPQFQKLQLKCSGQILFELEADDCTRDHYKLGYFFGDELAGGGLEVHCVDMNPMSGSLNGQYEDTSLVEKYRMSDSDYDSRKGTLRDWSKTQKEKDHTFSLAKHAKEHREKVEAKRQFKLGIFPLPYGYVVDSTGKDIMKDEPDFNNSFAESKDDATVINPELDENSVSGITVGSRCQVFPGNRRGVVSYVGLVPEIWSGCSVGGYWVGVTFDEPVGKTDGSVTNKDTKQKKYYFEASPGYASFVRGKNVEVGDFPELDIFDDDSDDEDEL